MNKNTTHHKIKSLKSYTHQLKPTVMIGNKGLTEQVIKEINVTINAHELIKLKINLKEREERKKIIEAICEKTHCKLIQQIGKIFVIYKERQEKS